MTAITLDNFNTDTDQNNNRHISLIWQKNKHKVFASTFILDVTKGENLLFLNITLRASGDAGTPIKAIDDELFVLSLTDPKFIDLASNELNASQVLLSLLNYSFS